MPKIRAIVLLSCSWGCHGATMRAYVVDDQSGNPVISAERVPRASGVHHAFGRSAELRLAKPGVAELIADLESDSNGRFEPVDLESGDYTVSLSKPNYITTSIRVRMADLGERLAIRLVRCGTIAGRVTNLAGSPIADAYVFALDGALPAHVQTDAAGEYRIFGLNPGKYSVAVAYGQPTPAVAHTGTPPALGPSGSGVAFYREKLTVVSGDDFRNIDFSIAPSPVFRVSGIVEAPEVPPGEFWVALASTENPDIATSVAIVGEARSFHFDGIRPGSYNLFVSGPSNGRTGFGAYLGEVAFFGRTRIEVTAQDVDDLHLRVAPALKLPILVKAGDGCSAKAEVSVSLMEDWAALIARSGKSGEDGNLVLAGLVPGRFRVYAQSDLCFQAAEVVADLSRGPVSRVEVRLSRGASIRAHVVPSMAIILFGKDETKTEMPDSGGNLEFTGLPTGHYRLKGSEALAKNVPELDLRAGEVRTIELDFRKPEEK